MGVHSERGFCGYNEPRRRGIAFFRGGVYTVPNSSFINIRPLPSAHLVDVGAGVVAAAVAGGAEAAVAALRVEALSGAAGGAGQRRALQQHSTVQYSA